MDNQHFPYKGDVMIETTLKIDTASTLGTISPRLYGQFAEHLGRCCYDGMWIGADNKQIPHHNGFRLDVVEALRKMPVPLLRWPGGCYAEHYHWRDGIGAPHQRPRRFGMSCGLQVEDDNGLGTHEFIEFCKLIGAEPYLAGNVGTGTPQELCDWMEYCNVSVNTDLTRLRAANGSAAPFNVRLWGVGNENWGCGGNYDVPSYANEYRRYATMMRHVDPKAELVVCGHNDEWNAELIKIISKHSALVDHYSIHSYWIKGGTEINFTEEEYYNLLAEVDETEDFVQRTADMIASEIGSKRRVGIALDEWGVWHPEARPWGPGEMPRNPIESHNYEQANTMRDAVATAAALEGFHRKANVLTLANLAQIVNVLHAPVMTSGAQMWLTPTYHVFQLHKAHIGAQAVNVEHEHNASIRQDKPAVTATATTKNGTVTITLINKHYTDSAAITLNGDTSYSQATAQLLSADSPRAVNSAQDPERVTLAPLTVENLASGKWRVNLPPHSVATIQFEQ
jgi:alpha-L-arabinofuranosidase